MTTKVTIEVDGAASVQTQGPAAAQGSATLATEAGNDAGSAPGLDASQPGPVPFVGAGSSASESLDPTFNPKGAISAGAAPADLMGGGE